ncbi:MAG: N-6 DNA methylase [Candidatus Hodarchaeota archaeon]
MSNFIDFLKKDNIIETLISQEITKKFHKVFLKKVIDNIEKSRKIIQNSSDSNNYYSNTTNLDLFGSIYERILNHKERKALGEFYTSFSIVDYILNEIGYIYNDNIESKKLIDISCGSGSFLIQAIRRLIDRYKIIYNKNKIAEFSLKEAKSTIQGVMDNIFGIDINPIACVLCQLNIQFTLFGLFKIIRTYDDCFQFPKFNIFNINAVNYNEKESFNFVVGNPPYLFIRDIPVEQRRLINSSDFKTKSGQYDYYQIFIELSINLLKDQGFLGYIVPDSLLVLSNRSSIRKHIYNSTKIREIFHTGPKFDDVIVSNIILILQKERLEEKRKKNIIQIRYQFQKNHQITQKIIENWDYKFLINLNSMDSAILDHLNKDFPKLSDLINSENYSIILSRGIELGKEGNVIFCTNCQKYIPLPKKELKCKVCNRSLNKDLIENIIYENLKQGKGSNLKPFIYSINRYKIKNMKYVDIEKQGINYKNLKIYQNRIIIRQLSEQNLISATYDKNFSLTSQSFYNLKILNSNTEEFNHLYVLGIINSTLLSYYFIKSFGSYKKLFPRILIEKIKEIPIKIPKTNEEKSLAISIGENVSLLLNSTEMNSTIQKRIDLLVFELYQIPTVNQEYIFDFMNSLN